MVINTPQQMLLIYSYDIVNSVVYCVSRNISLYQEGGGTTEADPLHSVSQI